MKLIFTLLLGVFASLTVLTAQQINVSGTVYDADTGTTLPGVTVRIKGTNIGTVTDTEGMFQISAQIDDTLIFSFIGMETVEKNLDGRSIIYVSLEPALLGLAETVIVAYGTQRRDAVTGSVGLVGADRMERVPMASFDQILQGQSAGVSSAAATGRPGAAARVTIRGVGSLSSSITPLYVIDGVPLSEKLNTRYDNPLSGLNPNDIESVTILKDAAATAIYGSRAANGVILVTTKRGTLSERSELLYRGQYGVSSLTQTRFNMMNTEQKLRFERDNAIFTRPDHVWDSLATINTNWRDEMFRTGITQSHELSSRGGNEKTRYFASGAYYTQDGILERSDYTRMSARLNLDHFISDRLKFGTSTHISYEESNFTVAEGAYGNNIYNPVFAAYLMNPYEQPRDDGGDWISSFDTYFGNPLRELELNTDFNNTVKILGNLFADFEPLDNLIIRSSLGIDFYDYTQNDYLHPSSVWGTNMQGAITRGFRRSYIFTSSTTARYSYLYNNNHSIAVLGGYETTQYELETFRLRGEGFASDKVRVPSATTSPRGVQGSGSAYTIVSMLSQLNYAYDDRYYADLGFRRDGSSRFGRNNRFANFWSVGIGWNARRMDFFSDLDYLSRLRFRASFGTTGNYSIGNYEHLGLYTLGLSYDQNPGSAPIRSSNPNLTWERSESFNFAVETEFFNRFALNIDLYRRTTKDMLLQMPVSLTSGFTSERRNVGRMTNRGVELSFDADVITREHFSWRFNTNFTYNHNVIDELYLDLDQFNSSSNIVVKIGESFGTFHYNRYAGVNPANGKPLWYDRHGNITGVFRAEDRVVLSGKSYNAPYFGGISSNLAYRNFRLDVLLTYTLDRWLLNNTRYFTSNQSNFGDFNQSADILNHWKEPGDNVHHPVYGTVPASIFDTRFLENASYLRLRNLSLSYMLPSAVAERMQLRNIRLYLQGQNLWTLTGYSGFDPEYPYNTEMASYPATRTTTLGIDLSL